jgi:signal transduction histidine kinase
MRLSLPPVLPVVIPRRLRLLFRLAFVALLGATVALALDVLHDEKQRSHAAYAEGVRKSEAQIAARLRHPTGQLMLLNAAAADLPPTPLVPLVLPFGAIDFDDRTKAQQAVELAGCGVVYGDGATLCAGIGSNPFAGAFVYVVGQLPAAALVPHRAGQLDLSLAHRAWVEVRLGSGESWRWIAPFQAQSAQGLDGATASALQRGRLVAFDADAEVTADSRPQRDVRGWMWQEGDCIVAPRPASATAAVVAAVPALGAPAAFGGATASDAAACVRRTYVSLRLPVPAWRDALDTKGAVAWPPAGLAATQVRLQLLGPGEGFVLFDSDNPARGGTAAASAPFALAEFRGLLLPGETLRVQREGSDGVILEARGFDPLGAGAGGAEGTAAEGPVAPWIDALIRWLPVAGFDAPIESHSTIATRLGSYRLTLLGDLRGVNRRLAGVATRLAGYIGAMLGAVLLLWALLEVVVMRRIALLTRRAAAVSDGMRAAATAGDGRPLNLTLEVKDLRGRDELGVLAQGLRDLLARVNADVEREQIRARQEREQWHAVGHEIVSPLQSLIALHGDAADPASRYLRRMQQAVRVLYGQASPSEAFESTQLTLAPLDLHAFLTSVAGNAAHLGIDGVAYEAPPTRLPRVLADEHSLEDAIAHVLHNAARHRRPGTPITLRAEAGAREVRLTIHNDGEAIPESLLPRIFDYGVSGALPASPLAAEGMAAGQRGQGLFVARTYMAKMGGTIVARNVAGGVQFELALPRSEGLASPARD